MGSARQSKLSFTAVTSKNEGGSICIELKKRPHSSIQSHKQGPSCPQSQESTVLDAHEPTFKRQKTVGFTDHQNSGNLSSTSSGGGILPRWITSPVNKAYNNVRSYFSGGSTEATTARENEEPKIYNHLTRWDRKLKHYQESSFENIVYNEWGRTPRRRRVILPCEEFKLERQPHGEEAYFDLYNEAELPFLDRRTEIGREVAGKVIQSGMDDDVMSDDDTIRCATSILNKELSKAITSYQNAFNKGALIRNLE